MSERWQYIDNWPYEVSDRGRVRAAPSRRVLKPRRHTNGYRRVTLCRSGEQRDFYIHRLVCEAFHGPQPPDRPEVDHINNVRHDNFASNLRWASVADNRADRRHAFGEQNFNSRLTDAIVRRIRLNPHSPSEDRALAARYGVSRETIRDVRIGKYWRHIDV